ncbi:MAG: hypothetical protein ACI9FB_002775 [Candidatus Azotimanducaceae bacterium]|jgi:hypothetical protein
MPDELIPIIIVPALLFCIAYITRVISDNRIRRELMNNNATSEIIQKLFLDNRDSDTTGNLKWGIVLIGIGLSLACIQITSLTENDPLTYGVVFIFGGAGLLLFYALSNRINKS